MNPEWGISGTHPTALHVAPPSVLAATAKPFSCVQDPVGGPKLATKPQSAVVASATLHAPL